MKVHLFAPQWQESGRTRELHDGALALREFFSTLTEEAVLEVPVDIVGDPVLENGILGRSILVGQLRRIAAALADADADRVLAIGGGCGIELPIVSHLRERHPELALVWFDAHGDINSPESSPSGHFHGMPLRFLTDPLTENLLGKPHNRVPHERVTLIGTRDLDPPEEEYIRKSGIRVLAPDPREPDLMAALDSCMRQHGDAYVHVDLDVLDPGEYRNVKCPAKDGIGMAALLDLIGLVDSRMRVVGMSVLENTESDRRKLEALAELLEFGLRI